MNSDHCGSPLSVYFQGRVYVVGFGEYGKAMEMLIVAEDAEWTILNPFGPFLEKRLVVDAMVKVDSELFVKGRKSIGFTFPSFCFCRSYFSNYIFSRTENRTEATSW
ncbi:unnamed protein product [Hymenolepis diminuta]|uniref:Uncharacterized protein n=1 Tax=Hymenolepis diminuta TaxID=6216 RepID=A0A564Y8X2_HYMDI|nr:unnamed protein product [Hymenolepis diminuta]